MGCSIGGGYTGEAECAEVREFPVLEPAVTVRSGRAADFAVGGG